MKFVELLSYESWEAYSVQGPPATCGPQGANPRDSKGQKQQKTQRGLSSQPPLVVCVSVQAEDRDDKQTADITACSTAHTHKVTIYRRRAHSICLRSSG
jgi:hypothetical protein